MSCWPASSSFDYPYPLLLSLDRLLYPLFIRLLLHPLPLSLGTLLYLLSLPPTYHVLVGMSLLGGRCCRLLALALLRRVQSELSAHPPAPFCRGWYALLAGQGVVVGICYWHYLLCCVFGVVRFVPSRREDELDNDVHTTTMSMEMRGVRSRREASSPRSWLLSEVIKDQRSPLKSNPGQ